MCPCGIRSPRDHTSESCEKGWCTEVFCAVCHHAHQHYNHTCLLVPPMDPPHSKHYSNNYNKLKRNVILADTMNGFLDKMKKASKGVVDAGAKTMLKVGSMYAFTLCLSLLSLVATKNDVVVE